MNHLGHAVKKIIKRLSGSRDQKQKVAKSKHGLLECVQSLCTSGFMDVTDIGNIRNLCRETKKIVDESDSVFKGLLYFYQNQFSIDSSDHWDLLENSLSSSSPWHIQDLSALHILGLLEYEDCKKIIEHVCIFRKGIIDRIHEIILEMESGALLRHCILLSGNISARGDLSVSFNNLNENVFRKVRNLLYEQSEGCVDTLYFWYIGNILADNNSNSLNNTSLKKLILSKAENILSLNPNKGVCDTISGAIYILLHDCTDSRAIPYKQKTPKIIKYLLENGTVTTKENCAKIVSSLVGVNAVISKTVLRRMKILCEFEIFNLLLLQSVSQPEEHDLITNSLHPLISLVQVKEFAEYFIHDLEGLYFLDSILISQKSPKILSRVLHLVSGITCHESLCRFTIDSIIFVSILHILEREYLCSPRLFKLCLSILCNISFQLSSSDLDRLVDISGICSIIYKSTESNEEQICSMAKDIWVNFCNIDGEVFSKARDAMVNSTADVETTTNNIVNY